MPDSNDENTGTNNASGSEIPVEVDAGTPADRATVLETEKRELHDRLLRTAADFDNFRKRSRKDADDARHKGREEVLREMLPVVDNLERAMAAAEAHAGEATSGGIVEGVRLVLRQLAGSLERLDVKFVTSVGEPFDPTRHEAIAQVPSDKPAGTVVSEMQRGYTLGGKLLRPAMVAVARGKEGGGGAPPAPTDPVG